MIKLKKIIFFLLFSLTLSQVLGEAAYAVHEIQFVIENMDGKSSSDKSFASDFACNDEEFTMNELVTIPFFTIKQSIFTQDFRFQNKYSISFWQPPKIS